MHRRHLSPFHHLLHLLAIPVSADKLTMDPQHEPNINWTSSPASPQPPPTTPSAFPENLPPRTGPVRSFQERTRAGIHPFFRETWYAYSLRHLGSRAKFWRRLAMVLTFLVRFVVGVFITVFGGYGRGSFITGWVIGAILFIISFFSYGWCLAAIGEAEGVRKVLRIPFVRRCNEIR